HRAGSRVSTTGRRTQHIALAALAHSLRRGIRGDAVHSADRLCGAGRWPDNCWLTAVDALIALGVYILICHVNVVPTYHSHIPSRSFSRTAHVLCRSPLCYLDDDGIVD